jgi:hypothetical protein
LLSCGKPTLPENTRGRFIDADGLVVDLTSAPRPDEWLVNLELERLEVDIVVTIVGGDHWTLGRRYWSVDPLYWPVASAIAVLKVRDGSQRRRRAQQRGDGLSRAAIPRHNG